MFGNKLNFVELIVQHIEVQEYTDFSSSFD